MRIERFSQGLSCSLPVYSQLLEIIHDLLFQSLGLCKVDDWRIYRFLQINYRFDDIAIARNNRTVETVQRILRVVIMLIYYVWHQNAVYLLILVEFFQMAVSQLGWEADVIAHNCIQGSFILAEG